MSNRVGRNEQCPCSSGKKYKNCCWDKAFRWVKNPDGTVSKEVPISKEFLQEFERYFDKFRQEHGREIRPHENIFSDLNLVQADADMILLLKQANIPPHLIYAYEKTGRIVTYKNERNLTDKELTEWDDAVTEYFKLHPEDHAQE